MTNGLAPRLPSNFDIRHARMYAYEAKRRVEVVNDERSWQADTLTACNNVYAALEVLQDALREEQRLCDNRNATDAGAYDGIHTGDIT